MFNEYATIGNLLDELIENQLWKIDIAINEIEDFLGNKLNSYVDDFDIDIMENKDEILKFVMLKKDLSTLICNVEKLAHEWLNALKNKDFVTLDVEILNESKKYIEEVEKYPINENSNKSPMVLKNLLFMINNSIDELKYIKNYKSVDDLIKSYPNVETNNFVLFSQYNCQEDYENDPKLMFKNHKTIDDVTSATINEVFQLFEYLELGIKQFQKNHLEDYCSSL